MTTAWPPDGLPEALLHAAAALTRQGFAAQYHASPEGQDYAAVTGVSAQVHCLDVRLGPASHRPGHTTHCMFQVFDPARPNIGLYFCYDRDDLGRPVDDHRLPKATADLERTITDILRPVLEAVLDPFDPTGRGRSVVVGRWHGRPSLSDLGLLPAKSLPEPSAEDQPVVVWADFKAPLSGLVTRMTRRFTRGRNVHLFPRTSKPSAIRIPVRDDDGDYVQLTDHSEALDKAIRFAQEYLRG